MRKKTLLFIAIFVALLALFVLLIRQRLNQNPNLPEDMRYLVQEGQIIDSERAKDVFVAYQTYKNVIIGKSDKKGETLIYERYDNNWFSGLGVKQLNKTALRIVIGRITSIDPVAKSKDVYITLEDPIKREIIFTGRIITSNPLMTDIRVEDVNILRNEEPYIQTIGTLGGTLKPIGELIKKGDIVVLQLTPNSMKDFSITKKDESGASYVTRIIIRRFGGKNNL